jgi:hypothetical protein
MTIFGFIVKGKYMDRVPSPAVNTESQVPKGSDHNAIRPKNHNTLNNYEYF